MAGQVRSNETLATLGFAARADGAGVAYVRIASRPGCGPELLRVPFVCEPLPALQHRDVAYAAVTQVAVELLRRGERIAFFETADERLVLDLQERRALPQTLAMPYVAVRCHLNRLHASEVVLCRDGSCRDLEARARADVSLDAAA